jgi:hypothetical protein
MLPPVRKSNALLLGDLLCVAVQPWSSPSGNRPSFFLCNYIVQCSIVFSPSTSLGRSAEDPERFGGENLFPGPLIPDSTRVRHPAVP